MREYSTSEKRISKSGLEIVQQMGSCFACGKPGFAPHHWVFLEHLLKFSPWAPSRVAPPERIFQQGRWHSYLGQGEYFSIQNWLSPCRKQAFLMRSQSLGHPIHFFSFFWSWGHWTTVEWYLAPYLDLSILRRSTICQTRDALHLVIIPLYGNKSFIHVSESLVN